MNFIIRTCYLSALRQFCVCVSTCVCEWVTWQTSPVREQRFLCAMCNTTATMQRMRLVNMANVIVVNFTLLHPVAENEWNICLRRPTKSCWTLSFVSVWNISLLAQEALFQACYWLFPTNIIFSTLLTILLWTMKTLLRSALTSTAINSKEKSLKEKSCSRCETCEFACV